MSKPDKPADKPDTKANKSRDDEHLKKSVAGNTGNKLANPADGRGYDSRNITGKFGNIQNNHPLKNNKDQG